jgi:hypothetical protein
VTHHQDLLLQAKVIFLLEEMIRESLLDERKKIRENLSDHQEMILRSRFVENQGRFVVWENDTTTPGKHIDNRYY